MNKISLIFLFILLSKISFAQSLPYNFLDTKVIPLKFQIIDEISTKEGILEGSIVKFRSIDDVFYNQKYILRKNDIVKARVENVITSGMNGFPAEIVIDNFEIDGIEKKQLQSVYIKKGQNRCFIVFPLKFVLTPIPFVGSLTNFIKGGHAKIKTKDVAQIYYYPNW